MNATIRRRLFFSAIAALLLLGGAARAEDKVTLKVADSLPTTHYMSIEGAKFFMARATELSHGHLAFEYYPSEQLGKARDMLKLTQSSVTDIGYIAPSYISDKLPLSAVAELPGLYSSSCSGTHGFYALAHGGILEQQEFKPNGVVALMAWNMGPYQIASRNPALHAATDFNGMKVRAAGGIWDVVLRQLGASPVNFPAPEMRDALERGTIDGTVLSAIGLKPYDLLGVIKGMTRGAAFGSFASTFSINARKFRALSAEDQAVLVQAGKEAIEHLCTYIDTNEARAQVEAEKAGVHFWTLNEVEREAAKQKLAPVVSEWSAALDARHLPADQVVKAFMAAAQ